MQDQSAGELENQRVRFFESDDSKFDKRTKSPCENLKKHENN
jgi:hypothetical protein